MSAAKLDPDTCRTLIQLIDFAIGAGPQDRVPCTVLAIDLSTMREQLSAAADLAERKPITEQRVREVVREVVVGLGIAGRAALPEEADAIATRAAKELAGAVVDVPRDAHCSPTGGGCELHPRGCPPDLAAAFDRAALAITGQPAAELTAQLKPATASIGPEDAAIIDRALNVYASSVTGAPLDDIDRIRALLCGPAPGGGS